MANILAVDDNLEVCKLIRTALERDSHRVETRQAGGALTESLCRWADCILLDVMMPGEDGFVKIRHRHPNHHEECCSIQKPYQNLTF